MSAGVQVSAGAGRVICTPPPPVPNHVTCADVCFVLHAHYTALNLLHRAKQQYTVDGPYTLDPKTSAADL